MKALFTAIAAVVLATSASASTVTLSNFSHKDLTGDGTAFDDVYTLNLAHNTWVGGVLTTSSLLGGLPAIDVQSVTLRRLGTGVDWAQIVAINWDVADTGVDREFEVHLTLKFRSFGAHFGGPCFIAGLLFFLFR